jgi:hypothetical protein
MSAYYQTVLSLNFAVFVLAAGLIAAIYQAVAGGGRPRVANLIWKNASLSVFLVLVFLNMSVSIVGAVLLGTDHDLVPGIDLGTDDILASPLMGLAIGATTVLCATLAVTAFLRASRTLAPGGAVAVITTRLRRQTSDAPAAPTEPADRAAELRQLEELRSQGLMTDQEFAAKRQAIIGRL